MSAKTNCILVDKWQVRIHDIFSINHDQSAVVFLLLELREVFTFIFCAILLISWFIA